MGIKPAGPHRGPPAGAAMNRGLSGKLKLAFPDVVPVERLEVELPQTIDPNWLAGFTAPPPPPPLLGGGAGGGRVASRSIL